MDSPSPRARLRAAILGVVIFVHGVAASPLPSSVSPKTFRNPIAKEEMDRWVGILGSVGYETNRKELIEDVIRVGSEAAELRGLVVKPFKPLLRITGTGQGWGLFTYPNTFPHRMIIEVHEGGTWREVFRVLDAEHDWMEGPLRFRRVRGVYDDNVTHTVQSYDNFVRWIAGRAFEDFPEADAVQVKMIRGHVTLPGTPEDTNTDIRLTRKVLRSAPEVVE